MAAAVAPAEPEPPKAGVDGKGGRPVAGVVGGGPAGLAAAAALAQRGFDVHVFDERPEPPEPTSAEWGNPERSYQLGIGVRGQTSLAELGAWDDVAAHCQPALGRLSFDKEGVPVATLRRDKTTTTMVLQRDRLQSSLLDHVRRTYPSVRLSYDSTCTSLEWSDRPTLTISDGDSIECDLVVGAEGVANDAVRTALAEKGVLSKRFPDDNTLVYKTIPLRNVGGATAERTVVTQADGSTVPADEKVKMSELNWGGRNSGVGLNFDALPTKEGTLIGVVLFKPDCAAVMDMEPTAEAARSLFSEAFPWLDQYLEDSDLEVFAKKQPKRLPSFSYAYPKLGHGNVALVGDAIHCVKPYFGQGVNSAFEDVVIFARCLDDARVRAAAGATGSDAAASDTPESIAEGVAAYSDARAKDSEALVEVSRSFDRPGKLGTFLFVFPLIVDGILHRLLPWVFEKNSIAMLSDTRFSFSEGRARKRRDRFLQLSLFAAVAVVALSALRAFLRSVLAF